MRSLLRKWLLGDEIVIGIYARDVAAQALRARVDNLEREIGNVEALLRRFAEENMKRDSPKRRASGRTSRRKR